MATGSFWLQLKALLLKDFRISMRSRVATALEIMFPIVFGAMAGLFIYLQVVRKGADASIPIPIQTVPVIVNNTWVAVVNNQQNATNIVMTAVEAAFKAMAAIGVSRLTVAEYTTSDAMIAAEKELQQPRDVVPIGISRGSTANNFTVYSRPVPFPMPATVLLPLAKTFIDAVYNVSQRSSVNISLSYLALPRTFYNNRALYALTGSAFLLYAFLPSQIIMGGRFVDEKRNRVRETLKVMGVSTAAYSLSQLLFGMFRTSAGTLVTSALLYASRAISAESILCIWGALLSFTITSVSFAQIMPALFTRNIWSNLSALMFLLVGEIIASLSTEWGSVGQHAVCLLSPAALFYAVVGPLSEGNVQFHVSYTTAIAMMWLDVLVYQGIAYYINQRHPGEFGIPKPPCFCIPCLHQEHTNAVASAPSSLISRLGARKEAIVVDNLTKRYEGSDFNAVDGLSFSVGEGEIFALLGHNGAGKSTTISTLIGVTTPSSCHAVQINGSDVVDDVETVRTELGICPQFDVLFDPLTARDHLEFFTAVRGSDPKDDDVHSYIGHLIKQLSLPTSAGKSAGTYSGGMKRRLSVANAFVGGGQVVLLDEPSSGMDPVSRREMWNLIRSERDKGRTIVLTTHFMEEADALGDYIGIMSRGRMFCSGTAEQLKDRYGVGHYLHVVKSTEKASVEKLVQLVATHVESPTVKQNGSHAATLVIPSLDVARFPQLLADVEKQLPVLGFASYGLSRNSLEDVFIAVSEKEEARVDAERASRSAPRQRKVENTSMVGATEFLSGSLNGDFGNSTFPTSPPQNAAEDDDAELEFVGIQSTAHLFDAAHEIPTKERLCSQIKTMLLRKMIFMRRSRRMQVMTFLFPIIMLGFGFMVIPQPERVGAGPHGAVNRLPDYNAMELLFVEQGQSTVTTRALRSAIEQQFALRPSGGSVKLKHVTSASAYVLGEYSIARHLSVTNFKMSSPPGGFLIQQPFHLGASSGTANVTSKCINATVLLNTDYVAAFAVELYAILKQAVEAVNRKGGEPIIASPPIQLPIASEAFPEATRDSTTTTTADPSDFMVYKLGLIGYYLAVSAVQLIGWLVVPIAEDIHGKAYHAMRVHGLTTTAYWCSNIIFDLMWCTVPLIVFTMFAGSCGIGPLFTSALLGVAVNYYLFCMVWLLLAYIVVLGREMRAPRYLSIFHTVNNNFSGGPYLLLLALKSSPSIAAELPKYQFLIYCSNPSVALIHTVDFISSYTRPQSTFTKLMTLSSGAVPETIALSIMLVLLGLKFVKSVKLSSAGVERVTRSQRRKQRKEQEARRKRAVADTETLLGGHQAEHCDDDADPDADQTIPDELPDEDGDVRAERLRVGVSPQSPNTEETTTNNNFSDVSDPAPKGWMVSCSRLRKRYGDGKLAVKDVSFGVNPGECFGLLGPNGAGKTTTISQLLKERTPTRGAVQYSYNNAGNSTGINDFFSRAKIGVCFQGDTLWEYMTAEEHMDIFLRLRLTTSYKPEDWQDYRRAAIERVQLHDVDGKLAATFSGGMKRKLAVCIAMYTGAQTVFLDEPSTGMDPFARRALWRVIQGGLGGSCGDRRRCVVLTTHSMEEAEAVCDRVGIVTGGRLRCVGSSQHLKNKFGEGYVLTLELNNASSHATEADAEAKTANFGDKKADDDDSRDQTAPHHPVDDLVASTFSGAKLGEVTGSTRRYSLKATGELSRVYDVLRTHKEHWGVRHYSVAQTSSLEHIFLRFARHADGDQ